MDASHKNAGVVIDQRLAPAGLPRVLGGYGNGRVTVLGLAALLFVGVTAALLLVPSPPASVSTLYILPVALVAAEIGTRVGMLCAAASIATVVVVPVSGSLSDGPATVVARSFALFFLAFVVGRLSDRAAKSRRMLEQVLEATTDSIYLKDLDGRYLLVNSAAARLIGRPVHEILGHSNTELLPDLAEEIADHDSDVIARDITDQRRLQAESTRFFDLSGDMLCTVDFDGHLRRVNGEWRRTLGWSPAELIGRHVSELMDREDHELMGEAGEEIVGAMLIAQDIHERVEREREISEAQERFRRAFEDAPIGMAVADLAGNYLEVNQALCAITGYAAQALCSMHFSAITHPEDLAGDLAEIKTLLEGELGTTVTEKRYLRADGGFVWVSRTATLVRDAAGVPLHFLDQVQDITERRRFERELRHLADHDPLTGLYNRRRFEQELDRQVAEVARYGPRGALLVLDLDHFKYVNDALGHHAGDELILSVAATLRGRLRESDILARLGGDEFAVLLPNVDEGGAQRVAADLVRAIREEAAVGTAKRRRRVTTSIGVAPFRAGDMAAEELLIAADLAMYDAKEAGRDGFAVVSRDRAKPDRARARVSWIETTRRCCASSRRGSSG